MEQTVIESGLEAVRRGAEVLKQHFGHVAHIAFKGKLDLVTDVDRRAEEEIVTFLRRATPDCGILAEERDEICTSAGSRWILDPLDGTTNFAHGYPFFCVSLAYEEDGCTRWGAVMDPLRDELFTAQAGKGAFCNGRQLQVSDAAIMSRAMLCTGFPYDVHDSPVDNLDHFTHFIKQARAIRRDGAAALDLCYVAMGRFDAFWEMKLKPWDMAAGNLMVTEAGGRVSGFDGSHLDPGAGCVLASNGHLHAQMLDIISRGRY